MVAAKKKGMGKGKNGKECCGKEEPETKANIPRWCKAKAKKELATNRFPKKARVNDDCNNNGETNCRSPRVARKQEVETVYIDESDSDEDDYNEVDDD